MTAYAVVNSKTCSCERAKLKPPYIQISAKSIVGQKKNGQTVTRPFTTFTLRKWQCIPIAFKSYGTLYECVNKGWGGNPKCFPGYISWLMLFITSLLFFYFEGIATNTHLLPIISYLFTYLYRLLIIFANSIEPDQSSLLSDSSPERMLENVNFEFRGKYKIIKMSNHGKP